MNLAVLVHTFDGYKHLWPGCLKAWNSIAHNDPSYCYFGTDTETDFNPEGFKKIYSGRGQWSDRLAKLLQQIPADYLLYCQEDHWPFLDYPDFEAAEIIEKHDLLRLQISPVNQFYTLHGHDTLFFHHTSKYLVSHQPSIWRKDFLLSCLKPGESPWVNEYEGTKRLQNRPEIRQKIAIYPYDWYEHKCIKGQVVGSI